LYGHEIEANFTSNLIIENNMHISPHMDINVLIIVHTTMDFLDLCKAFDTLNNMSIGVRTIRILAV